MRQFGVEVGATRQRESGLTLPRSAGSDARCRARLAQPSSQLPRDDLTPTTRQSSSLQIQPHSASNHSHAGVRRLAAADGQAPTDIHTRASAAAPTAPAGRGTDAPPRPGSRRVTPVPLTVLLPVTGSALECPVDGSA